MTDERAGEVMRELGDLAAGGALTDHDADLLRDAADEIERLRAALKPFAAIAEHFERAQMPEQTPDTLYRFRLVVNESAELRLSDCKRAAEVLK